jgi:hypothetical protein
MTKWLIIPFQLTRAAKTVRPVPSENWRTIRYVNRADLHRNPCYIIIVHSEGAQRDELERAIDSVRWNNTPVILLVHESQRAFVEECVVNRVKAPLENYTGTVSTRDQQNWVREIAANTTPTISPDQVRLILTGIQQMPPQTGLDAPQTERIPMNPFEGTLIWTDDDNRRLIVLIALFPGRLDLIQKYYSGHRDIFGTANAINTYFALAHDNTVCIEEEDGRPTWVFQPEFKAAIEQFVVAELCLSARAARTAARGSQTIVATDLAALKRRAEDMFLPEKAPLYFGELTDEQYGFFGRGFILNSVLQERETAREYMISTMEYESWRAAVGTRTDLRHGRLEKLEQVAGFHLQAQTLLGGDVGYKILFAPAFSQDVIAAAAGFMHRMSLLDWLNLTYLCKFKAENERIEAEKARPIFNIRTGLWNVWRSLEPFKKSLD